MKVCVVLLMGHSWNIKVHFSSCQPPGGHSILLILVYLSIKNPPGITIS